MILIYYSYYIIDALSDSHQICVSRYGGQFIGQSNQYWL